MARNITDEDVKAIADAILASLKDQAIGKDEFVEAVVAKVVAAVAGKDEIVTAVADAVVAKLHTGAAFNVNMVAVAGKPCNPADPTTMPVMRFR